MDCIPSSFSLWYLISPLFVSNSEGVGNGRGESDRYRVVDCRVDDVGEGVELEYGRDYDEVMWAETWIEWAGT